MEDSSLQSGGPLIESATSNTEKRILDAARQLFFAYGFSAVSTDKLSRTAGVSKSSIYKYFGDMAGVLAAVVRREGDEMSIGVGADPITADTFWQSLIGFGTNLLNLMNQDFCVQLDRMLHEEARSHPDMIRQFYESAHGRGHKDLSALLVAAKARGFVTKPQAPEALADNILSMWFGLACVRSRFGLQDRPHGDPEAWALQCVETLFAEDLARFRASLAMDQQTQAGDAR